MLEIGSMLTRAVIAGYGRELETRLGKYSASLMVSRAFILQVV